MKLVPYARHHLYPEDIRAVINVLKSDYITQGPLIEKFERGLADYCGVRYAVAVSSGTAALHVACLAAGIRAGDEVVTSPLTFAASANCVLYCGGKVAFADVAPDTGNIAYKEIEKKLNRRTAAVIPVHYGGHPCDLEEIHGIAKRRNLIIIEDAAHALGAGYKSHKIGSCRYSDMAIFSFHPAKHITTGEGGAILTNRKDLYERLKLFRNHGIAKQGPGLAFKNKQLIGGWYYEMRELGFNYRITDIQCALGLSQLDKLDIFLKRRRKIVNIYNKEFSKSPGITLPAEKSYATSSWHLYYIRLSDERLRKRVFDKLRRTNIGVQVHYIPVYWHPYYRRSGYRGKVCPVAEDFYKRTISIPLYESMPHNTALRVIAEVRKALKRA